MRAFYLISCFVMVGVMARPEPPVNMGLQQQMQGASSWNGDNSFANFAAPVPTYGTPGALTNSDSSAPVMQDMQSQQDSYNAAYQHSSSQSHASGYDNGPQETQVHKHIYVHVPPKDFEENDVQQPRVTHQAGPKQKHYKIVFIKAPSAPAIQAPIVPPLPQNEEKTLIYVLHKKPEAHPDIVIPTAAPTKPSKPEVFFIKYKTRKEEAPVYGPPQAQARQSNDEFVSPMQNEEFSNAMLMDPSQYEMVTDPTQQQSNYEEQSEQQQQQQPEYMQQEVISNEASAYSAPTLAAYSNEEVQPTAAQPLNQYLPPETTAAPIVVEDMILEQPRAPAVNYGPPTRYFVKQRK